MGPSAVSPGRTEYDLNLARATRAIFHLHSFKPVVPVRNEVERRVLRRREQNNKTLAHEVRVRLGDTKVALILRVMGHDPF